MYLSILGGITTIPRMMDICYKWLKYNSTEGLEQCLRKKVNI